MDEKNRLRVGTGHFAAENGKRNLYSIEQYLAEFVRVLEGLGPDFFPVHAQNGIRSQGVLACHIAESRRVTVTAAGREGGFVLRTKKLQVPK